jgi:hypothetical protein
MVSAATLLIITLDEFFKAGIWCVHPAMDARQGKAKKQKATTATAWGGVTPNMEHQATQLYHSVLRFWKTSN